jgi:hypothetical protein
LRHQRGAQCFRSLQVRELSGPRRACDRESRLGTRNSSKIGASNAANGSYGRRNSGGVACTKRGFLLPETPLHCTSTRTQRQMIAASN